MPKRLTTTTRWTWSAAAACLVAGSLLAWQLTSGDEIIVTAPPAATEQQAAPEAAAETETFELAPAEEYAEITERPLFSRSRRPDAVDEGQSGANGAGGGEEAAAARISITGILLTGPHRVVLLRLDDDPKVMHVAEGQEAGGWLIESIHPDKILLRRGDAASEVILDYKRKPGAPAGVAGGGRPAKGGRGGRPEAPQPADPSNENDEAVE